MYELPYLNKNLFSGINMKQHNCSIYSLLPNLILFYHQNKHRQVKDPLSLFIIILNLIKNRFAWLNFLSFLVFMCYLLFYKPYIYNICIYYIYLYKHQIVFEIVAFNLCNIFTHIPIQHVDICLQTNTNTHIHIHTTHVHAFTCKSIHITYNILYNVFLKIQQI